MTGARGASLAEQIVVEAQRINGRPEVCAPAGYGLGEDEHAAFRGDDTSPGRLRDAVTRPAAHLRAASRASQDLFRAEGRRERRAAPIAVRRQTARAYRRQISSRARLSRREHAGGSGAFLVKEVGVLASAQRSPAKRRCIGDAQRARSFADGARLPTAPCAGDSSLVAASERASVGAS